MAESLKTAQSILWMIERLKDHGEFLYDDWASRFRPDGDMDPRDDRKFHKHLKLFREDALALFKGERDVELVADHGVYRLSYRLDQDRLEQLNDPHGADFIPLLHGLNARRGLVPIPSARIEDELVEGLDIDTHTLGRVIYKNAFTWKMDPKFIRVFLDAVHSGTKLFVIPEGDRSSRTITPLYVVAYEGAWHLLGLDGNLCQYSLSRVNDIQATSVAAEPIPVEVLNRLKAEIDSTFGINLLMDWNTLHTGKEVIIRYTGKAIRYARERFDMDQRRANDPWFTIEDQEEFVDVTLRVHAYGEVIAEALRWGPCAEALKPEDFRNLWFEEIEAMVAAFL